MPGLWLCCATGPESIPRGRLTSRQGAADRQTGDVQIVRVLAAVLGAVIALVTSASVLRTLVIPRGRLGRLPRWADTVTKWFFRLATARMDSYRDRDGVLAAQGPMFLLTLLAAWLLLFLVAFTLLLWPQTRHIGESTREAGSSLLTLGFQTSNHPWATAIDFFAAATGLATVALQIGYLPTIYGAFNRRETEVTLLGARAGNPPFGPELLARTRVGLQAEGELDGLYQGWERWAADVAESHSNYPALIRFRSPQPYTHWVVAMLAVMDSAALLTALAPSRAPVSARLALRMGFLALRQIADAIQLPYDPDPRPDDGIELAFEEFESAVQSLTDVGFECERDVFEAWQHFAGWRINYEAIAYRLCAEVDAVPALWSGPRHRSSPPLAPLRPPVRSPEQPDGMVINRSWSRPRSTPGA